MDVWIRYWLSPTSLVQVSREPLYSFGNCSMMLQNLVIKKEKTSEELGLDHAMVDNFD
jgi:hypothetical protein